MTDIFYIIWLLAMAGLVYQSWQISRYRHRARGLRKAVIEMRARLLSMWLGRIQIKEGQQMLTDGIEVTRNVVERLHNSLMDLSFKIMEKTSEDPNAAQRAKARHDRASRRFFNRVKELNSTVNQAADDLLQPEQPLWQRPRPDKPADPKGQSDQDPPPPKKP